MELRTSYLYNNKNNSQVINTNVATTSVNSLNDWV